MAHSRYLLALALAVLLPGAGCTPTTIDGEMASLTVYGQVTRSDGTPAAGVRIEVEARVPGDCTQRVVAGMPVETDADGRYRTSVMQWGSRFDACLFARAVPGAGMAAGVDSLTVAQVEMRAVRPDSVRLDFALDLR
jgi:hypothetical protein